MIELDVKLNKQGNEENFVTQIKTGRQEIRTFLQHQAPFIRNVRQDEEKKSFCCSSRLFVVNNNNVNADFIMINYHRYRVYDLIRLFFHNIVLSSRLFGNLF